MCGGGGLENMEMVGVTACIEVWVLRWGVGSCGKHGDGGSDSPC